MALTCIDDMLRLRWFALEWSCAHLRGDVEYLDEVWVGALAAFGQDEFAAEVALLAREFVGRPETALWLALARLDAQIGRGVSDA